MLKLQNVSHWFDDASAPNDGQSKVLDNLSLTLNRGQSLALMGTSGSGKSTLLQVAAGLELPKQGRVELADLPIYELTDDALSALRREQLGFVFQQFNLLPGLSVIDNILFQSRLNQGHQQHEAIDSHWLDHLMTTMALHEVSHRLPEQLSGGQQQRVAIARAVAHKPAIVFADEPTGNLNDSLSHTVMELLMMLSREANCALLMVTHSAAMAGYTDRVLTLQSGKLEQAQNS
ncbi:ABC transporter ATP-binding protein [Neiella marina]|uniref:ABC transporter ATP-binding protein n=1 Tax=Neiella holothuriorum TaxID=2870530 RepID=A0ABS7EFE9_9GAMM|nr:ABC transporter ATP-binding protein [Neiella holothuriorum]MBW8190511.1 ABC transporter ATP-binding protein [Neiella holothuriorum]